MGMMADSPAIVDRDNDGFIDTAYVGDLAGNPWKFTFCPFDPDTTKSKQCNTNIEFNHTTVSLTLRREGVRGL